MNKSTLATRAIVVLTLLASIAVAVLAALHWQLGASAMGSYIALAVICCAVAPFAAGAGAWRAWRGAAGRPSRLPRGPRMALAALAAVACVALVTAILGSWAGTDPAGRYTRHYAAAGKCLAGTPYAAGKVTVAQLQDVQEQKRGKVVVRKKHQDRMAVRPTGLPRSEELVFDHASKGSRPTPENARSKAILAAHGCAWKKSQEQ